MFLHPVIAIIPIILNTCEETHLLGRAIERVQIYMFANFFCIVLPILIRLLKSIIISINLLIFLFNVCPF